MKRKLFAIANLICAGVLQAFSQGYIIPDGVTIYPGNEIHVVQNPVTQDYTGFSLVYQGNNTFAFFPFLDEGVRTTLTWYDGPSNPNSSYGELTAGATYIFANGSTFCLDFYTGYNPWIYTPEGPVYTGNYSDPVYGWANFKNVNGVLEILNSSLVYTGTLNIPEPSSCVLGLFGLVGLWGYRRMKVRA